MFQVLGKRLVASAASALVCAAALIPTPASALTVNLSGTSANNCSYSSISVDPSGNVTINCQGVVVGPGTIGFTASIYPAVVTNEAFTVMVSRMNGATGAQTATVSANSACTLPNGGAVSWNDSDTGTKIVSVAAGPLFGACALSLTTSAVLGLNTTSIQVNTAGGPGSLAFSAATYTAVEVSTSFTAVINRSGGTSGAISTIVTGSGSCSTGSPQITFAPGEVTKSLSVNASGTQGTCTLNLTNLTGGATLGSPSVATVTVNATNTGGGGGSCATSPPGVLSGTFGNQGQWQQPLLSTTQIISFPITNVGAGLVTLSQTAITPSPILTELSISKCPGDMDYGRQPAQQVAGYYPCYQTTQNPSGLNIAWHKTVGGHFAYCYTPDNQGPWYVNLRLTYPSCPWGQCGVSIQWNLP